MAHRVYPPLVGLSPENNPPFNSFEMSAVAILQRHLAQEKNDPLLTNNEDDLAILDDTTFFDAVSQGSVPYDVMDKLRSGELTRTGLVRNMQIGRNIVRREKSFMFTERLMTAVYAADTCRSYFRVATRLDDQPVLIKSDDTLEGITARVGDYVTDLLVAGRERRVLRGAAMDRLTQTIRAKFDTNPDAKRVLTGLAGQNSMKKVNHYAHQLHTVSKGYERMDASTKKMLMEYMVKRPIEFQGKPDLSELLLAQAKS
jgi:hypothetical protein